eukprot:3210785-Pleurochrysis_carterae.AAC.1
MAREGVAVREEGVQKLASTARLRRKPCSSSPQRLSLSPGTCSFKLHAYSPLLRGTSLRMLQKKRC